MTENAYAQSRRIIPRPELVPLRQASKTTIFQARNVNAWYCDLAALVDVSLPVNDREVLALIGQPGCGKRTFLRSLNRANDSVKGFRLEGSIRLYDQEIYSANIDVEKLRRRIGLVVRAATPFHMSIFDNVAFGVRIISPRVTQNELSCVVEAGLRSANLWAEVRDKLDSSGLALSNGQQKLLCIARALAVKPDVLMLDEPCDSLDPMSTGRIEELTGQLRESHAIVVATHNLAQALRVSDRMALFLKGRLIEYGGTRDMSIHPRNKKTEDCLCGSIG